jgi:hypothetical protein
MMNLMRTVIFKTFYLVLSKKLTCFNSMTLYDFLVLFIFPTRYLIRSERKVTICLFLILSWKLLCTLSLDDLSIYFYGNKM